MQKVQVFAKKLYNITFDLIQINLKYFNTFLYSNCVL